MSAHSEPSPGVKGPYRSQGQCLRRAGKYQSETARSPSEAMFASTPERQVWTRPKQCRPATMPHLLAWSKDKQ